MSNQEHSQSVSREADGRTPVAPGAEDGLERAAKPRAAWRRPVITRVGLESTLFGGGGNIDGHGGSNPG